MIFCCVQSVHEMNYIVRTSNVLCSLCLRGATQLTFWVRGREAEKTSFYMGDSVPHTTHRWHTDGRERAPLSRSNMVIQLTGKRINYFRKIAINSSGTETLPMEIIYSIVTYSLSALWESFISLLAVNISPLIKFRPLWNFYRHMDDFQGSPSSWRCLLLLRRLLGIQLEVSLSEYWSLSVVFVIVYLYILQAWNRGILRPF
jgi:hypothetical protein